jgi:AcrR family transcriptional regulator
MPRNLSEDEVSVFRERLCEVAARLFAERGPDAVPMRQLATELGVSPMTPYRYFRDKDDILAAVRTRGFNRFAEALEKARDSVSEPAAVGEAVCNAYLDFAVANPHIYKLIFDVNQPTRHEYPDLMAAERRARDTMSAWVKDQIEAGLIIGDPEEIGCIMWASTHGLIVLELAGKLPKGAARPLKMAALRLMEAGCRPQGKASSSAPKIARRPTARK